MVAARVVRQHPPLATLLIQNHVFLQVASVSLAKIVAVEGHAQAASLHLALVQAVMMLGLRHRQFTRAGPPFVDSKEKIRSCTMEEVQLMVLVVPSGSCKKYALTLIDDRYHISFARDYISNIRRW